MLEANTMMRGKKFYQNVIYHQTGLPFKTTEHSKEEKANRRMGTQSQKIRGHFKIQTRLIEVDLWLAEHLQSPILRSLTGYESLY